MREIIALIKADHPEFFSHVGRILQLIGSGITVYYAIKKFFGGI